MRLIRDYSNVPASAKGGVLALGNFDGVHRGHRAVIAEASRIARGLEAPVGVLTFEPHPRQVFAPMGPPFRLTPFRSKFRRLGELGLDILVCLRFNEALYTLTAEDFVLKVLVEGLGVRHIVVGYDFVFGKQRQGNTDLLKSMGAEHGFSVTVVEAVAHDDDVCSSTIIRVDLGTGRVRRAAELLGHWWEVEGRVRGGDQRGRSIGFPTANLHLRAKSLQPALGVYAIYFGLVEENGTRWLKGVANLGTRPTFDGKGVVLESHIFDFDESIYGALSRVAFVEHLRGERKFDGIDALTRQIAADREAARELLAQPEYAIDNYLEGNGAWHGGSGAVKRL